MERKIQLPFKMLHHLSQKPRVISHFPGLDVHGVGARAVGLPVQRQVGRSSDREGQETGHTARPGGFQKPTLSLLLGPVVSSIRILETLGPAPFISYAAFAALLPASRSNVKPPQRQTDAFRLSVVGNPRAEQ